MICNQLASCAKGQFEGNEIERCPNYKVKCIESSDERSKIKCEERNKKYVLDNTLKNHVILYKMDGGIISVDKTVPEGTCKCDYLFVSDGNERNAILVELKGTDMIHSLKQLDETLTLFRPYFSTLSHVYGRGVVTSSIPNIKANPTYVNLAKKFRRTYHGNLKIFERQYQEKDVELERL